MSEPLPPFGCDHCKRPATYTATASIDRGADNYESNTFYVCGTHLTLAVQQLWGIHFKPNVIVRMRKPR